jgi:hypothetical protein
MTVFWSPGRPRGFKTGSEGSRPRALSSAGIAAPVEVQAVSDSSGAGCGKLLLAPLHYCLVTTYEICLGLLAWCSFAPKHGEKWFLYRSARRQNSSTIAQ